MSINKDQGKTKVMKFFGKIRGNKRVAMLGVGLGELVEREGGKIPKICKWCISFIKREALSVQGLFRLPGGAFEVRQLQKAFEMGKEIEIHNYSSGVVHAVCSLLKLFLRELPDPLTTSSLYTYFLQVQRIAGDKEQYLSQLKEVVERLPEPNFVLLKKVSCFRVLSDLLLANKQQTDLQTVFKSR